MKTSTDITKIYSINDIKCNCHLTGGCEYCFGEVEKLNNSTSLNYYLTKNITLDRLLYWIEEKSDKTDRYLIQGVLDKIYETN